MKLKKKALLYDIANMAYLIADTGHHDHTLHRVRDICQEGNIDRVSRVLGLAFARLAATLSPIAKPSRIDIDRDNSACPHDYEIIFRDDRSIRFALTTERKLKFKELSHEYMVCTVLADWLEITFPEAADVWKDRSQRAFSAIRALLSSIIFSGSVNGFHRKLSPF